MNQEMSAAASIFCRDDEERCGGRQEKGQGRVRWETSFATGINKGKKEKRVKRTRRGLTLLIVSTE